jgi:hypothetical protein
MASFVIYRTASLTAPKLNLPGKARSPFARSNEELQYFHYKMARLGLRRIVPKKPVR